MPLHWVSPFGDVGQTEHEGPQAVLSVAATQVLLQRFLPAGHVSPQGSSTPMHSPSAGQAFLPAGHVTPHLVPSQVASPPLIPAQGSQAKPQWEGLRLLLHSPSHLWNPG